MKRKRDETTIKSEPKTLESPPEAAKPTPTKPTIYGHVKPPVQSTWIEYTPEASNKRGRNAFSAERRRDVRVHAAAASAAARKATIAKKEAERARRHQRLAHRDSKGGPAEAKPPLSLKDATDLVKAVNNLSGRAESGSVVHDQASFTQLVEVVTELQDWYLCAFRATSLAHTAVRTMLWAAITNSTTLFQAAIFVAGTHTNSCGLPPSAVHMGAGLIVLRGASLEAIQAAVVTADAESMPSVAIAMLAGWERRFGDRESYEVHMRAWRSLALPPKALEENHVSTLTDVTLQMYKDNLDERAQTSDLMLQPVLNPGFYVFESARPEARSLLSIVSLMRTFDPTASSSIQLARRLAVENIAWSPTHTRSCEPLTEYEKDWDQAELTGLYHVRAVNITILGFQLKAALDAHKVVWEWDLMGALHVHTVSCQHLRTQELMGTKYEESAVWSRFLMCAAARDPERDEQMRSLLQQLGIETWDQMRMMLESLWYCDALLGSRCRVFFDLLTHGSGDEDGG